MTPKYYITRDEIEENKPDEEMIQLMRCGGFVGEDEWTNPYEEPSVEYYALEDEQEAELDEFFEKELLPDIVKEVQAELSSMREALNAQYGASHRELRFPNQEKEVLMQG